MNLNLLRLPVRRARTRLISLVAVTIVALLAFIAPSTFLPVAASGVATAGAAREELSPVPPASECEALAAQDFAALPEAATQIQSAEVVPAAGATPEHCLVTGYVAPQIQFELRLPTRAWTGRFLQLGCGGYCGYTVRELEREGHLGGCIPADLGEFAVASGNSGHAGYGALWAEGAPQLRIDWGYRSEHVLSVASKAIITAYYGQVPRYAYFAGCSNGGRQALMLAQRYPADFDGILAGAPGHAFPALMLAMAWSARANVAPNGNPVLTPESMPLLHRAALAACDGRDGLVDGQITDPRACQFDPATLQCPDGQGGPDCLTPAQVETARKLYSGPVDEHDRHLYPGGLPAGSELQWQTLLFGFFPGDIGFAESITRDYLAHLATWDEPISFDELRFDRVTFNRLAAMSPIYDATDPDLRPFRDRGGKLILWHGWEDAYISAAGTLAYYQAVQDVAGGLAATQQFARLYMLPGYAHCVGGTGPASFDVVHPLLAWVEQGVAPEGVVTAQERDGEVVRTRPVYPYPAVARYGGTGSIDDAANFVAAPPATPADDHVDWLGAFRSGYQGWCSWEGNKLVCRPDRPGQR